VGKKSCFDFNVGEKVVYPGYGIGEVLKIVEDQSSGKSGDCPCCFLQ